ncbi:hypothetical protein SRABI84_04864 [Peribacillus simplex]|uniref:hypothetical protein n=1 Tax=Peribacillus simplex TaxID=1478 RepID=UPI001E131836|nr:hypothetical protein [Peribacillus simplex]CAH0311170.1 hypothetical protein SRABI84_04864 [Peribacillus simplex]
MAVPQPCSKQQLKVAGNAKDAAASIIVTVYNIGIFGGLLAAGFILSASNAYALPWTVLFSFLYHLFSYGMDTDMLFQERTRNCSNSNKESILTELFLG